MQRPGREEEASSGRTTVKENWEEDFEMLKGDLLSSGVLTKGVYGIGAIHKINGTYEGVKSFIKRKISQEKDSMI